VAVTYVQTSGLPSLVVSPTGLITTSGALTAGTYRVTGSTSDSFGDVGVFVLNLTVTTPAAIVVASHPRPTRVIGYAMAGKSELLAIAGSGFYGRPVITSHAGTTVLVTRDSGSLLIVRVTVKSRSPRGTFTFTVTLANGKSGRVKYNQR